ncbi:hypothetical protein D5S17_24175 [Pseudonocardiaceae bacterium YIM PH 21723]|nr:hypothetical protein D5S17_24175 [Pseudonocardiaceae bacterium YIM PH 21723]
MDSDELAAVIEDAEVVAALRRFAELNHLSLAPSSDSWKRKGDYTGARLHTLAVGGDQLVLKICPAGEHREAGRARQAAELHGTFAKNHLVSQAHYPVPMPDGRVLMFLRINGSLRFTRPFGDDDMGDQLAELCPKVIASLHKHWQSNTLGPTRMSAAELVQEELDHGLGDDQAADLWARNHGLDTATQLPFAPGIPNPYHLLRSDDLAGVDVDVLRGGAHGDLHLNNILLVADSARRGLNWRLIDLSEYSDSAPRSRDVVQLMLSCCARYLSELNLDAERPSTALIDQLVLRQAPKNPPLDPESIKTLNGIYGAALKGLPGGREDSWRDQYLLSLAGKSLVHTSYVDLGEERRRWFARLAGRAVEEFLGERDVPLPQAESPKAVSAMAIRRLHSVDLGPRPPSSDTGELSGLAAELALAADELAEASDPAAVLGLAFPLHRTVVQAGALLADMKRTSRVDLPFAVRIRREGALGAALSAVRRLQEACPATEIQARFVSAGELAQLAQEAEAAIGTMVRFIRENQ